MTLIQVGTENGGRSALDRKIHDEFRALAETVKAEREKSKESAEIAARIEKLRKESRVLWDTTLRSARLFGRNPHPGKDAARIKDFQQNLKYHTTADWDHRTREEVSGKVPAKMKEWLKKVRGY